MKEKMVIRDEKVKSTVKGTGRGINVVNFTEIDKRGNAEQEMELQPSVNKDMGSRRSLAAGP